MEDIKTKTFEVNFVALQPVESRGYFQFDGPVEDAEEEFKRKLEESFGKDNYHLLEIFETDKTEEEKRKLN